MQQVHGRRETCRQPSRTIKRGIRRRTEISWHQNAAEALGGGAQGSVGGKDRTRRGADDFLRHASHQYARNAAAAVRAHHDQSGIHSNGQSADLRCRIGGLDREDGDVSENDRRRSADLAARFKSGRYAVARIRRRLWRRRVRAGHVQQMQ